MTHAAEVVLRARSLANGGLNVSEVARALGLSRSTVRSWLSSDASGTPVRPSACARCEPSVHLDGERYVYLLGLYLGDGCLSRQRRDVWRLRISQTARYVDHIEECAAAMATVLPNRVLVQQRVGCVEIGASSKHWICLFPQHGPGRKHERPIVLHEWQRRLVEGHPKSLLRGLIQSDGCRNDNFVTTGGRRVVYPRYTFSNASADVRGIFVDACSQLGVHWTHPSERVVSIARRRDVKFLDTFIGPKC